MSSSHQQRGSALVAALLTFVLAGVVAAALAELGRLAIVRARLARDGARAWFLAEAGLADALAGIPPGHDFSALLGTAEASGTGTPWTYAASFQDDADDSPADPTRDLNAQVLLQVTAFGPAPVRRRLRAMVGRGDPLLPGAATLAGGVGALIEDFRLDGRNYDMGSGCTLRGGGNDRAGLAVPEGVVPPVLADPEQVTGAGDAPSIVHVDVPDLSPLAAEPADLWLAAGSLPSTLGSNAAPQFTVVEGDAIVDAAAAGAGVLFSSGRLLIDAPLQFTGVVAAAGGIEITEAGDLTICGALWASGDPALAATGRGTIRASSEAIRGAARVAPLPARARLIAARELF